jgi:hypothetical protein
VQDHRVTNWGEHAYARFDLQQAPLSFTLDLSTVT